MCQREVIRSLTHSWDSFDTWSTDLAILSVFIACSISLTETNRGRADERTTLAHSRTCIDRSTPPDWATALSIRVFLSLYLQGSGRRS